MHSEWSDGSPTLARDRRRLPGTRLSLRRRHRSFARLEDRRRDVDGRRRRAARARSTPQRALGDRFRLCRASRPTSTPTAASTCPPRKRRIRPRAGRAAFEAAQRRRPDRAACSPPSGTRRSTCSPIRAAACPDRAPVSWRIGTPCSPRRRDAGVAIEIDGDPARQDLDYTLAARALAAGCLFALDSDAHTTSQLRYAETALAHARLAGIPFRSHRQLLAHRAAARVVVGPIVSRRSAWRALKGPPYVLASRVAGSCWPV